MLIGGGIASIFKRSSDPIDWDRFVVGFVFGYAMSMLPLALNYIDRAMAPDSSEGLPVHLSSETYIVFSVLALASIGGVLSNVKKRGVLEFLIVGLSIFFGFVMYHFSKILEEIESESSSDLLAMNNFMEVFFYSSLMLSIAFFAAANVSSKEHN